MVIFKQFSSNERRESFGSATLHITIMVPVPVPIVYSVSRPEDLADFSGKDSPPWMSDSHLGTKPKIGTSHASFNICGPISTGTGTQDR